MDKSLPHFDYFRTFIIAIQIYENSIDVVLWESNLDRRVEDAFDSSELWRPPFNYNFSQADKLVKVASGSYRIGAVSSGGTLKGKKDKLVKIGRA